jgi:hypothetical protein
MWRRGVTFVVDFDNHGRSPLRSEASPSTTALTSNATTTDQTKRYLRGVKPSFSAENDACLCMPAIAAGHVSSEVKTPGVAVTAKLFQGSLCSLTELKAGPLSGPQRITHASRPQPCFMGTPNRVVVQWDRRAPPFLRNEAQV